jgi:hypothetical protein
MHHVVITPMHAKAQCALSVHPAAHLTGQALLRFCRWIPSRALPEPAACLQMVRVALFVSKVPGWLEPALSSHPCSCQSLSAFGMSTFCYSCWHHVTHQGPRTIVSPSVKMTGCSFS